MRRRLCSESQLDKDYFLSTIEQHKVDDITISAFYQSRTLTVLAAIWISLAFIACSRYAQVETIIHKNLSLYFLRSASNSLEENLFHGFIAVFVIFIFVSVMIMPNGKYQRA